MVFLGVLLAFYVNDWGESKREKDFVKNIMENMIQDVKKDSIEITKALEFTKKQHDSLLAIIAKLEVKDYKSANRQIYWSYGSYNVFNPSTETFASMVFGGDLKLLRDFNLLRAMKDINQINRKLEEVHSKYYNSLEMFKNEFICKGNIQRFDFQKKRTGVLE
jgi:hypothetical protein